MARKPAETENTTTDAAPAVADDTVTVTGIATLDIAFPTKRGGGQPSKFPFDTLEEGAMFGVKGKTKRQIANAVSAANKRYRNELKDDSGAVVNTIQTRKFVATDVTDEIAPKLVGTALEGATVLVKREAVS